MATLKDPFKTLKTLNKEIKYYSLPLLEEHEKCGIERLPVSIRLMLESLLRNCDGSRVREEDVRALARWNAEKPQGKDIPFVVSRVLLQDFTGVPLLVDLAAMRSAVADQKKDSKIVEPEVPVDLIVDHSVQVDKAGSEDAFMFNLEAEFSRNIERYTFLKWGQEAFKTFTLVPPGIGICHQVNLEHLATVVTHKNGIAFPDTLVGTDSHTTMINGLGVLGWGVGGIEAEAAMLRQPVFLQMPEVIGVHLSGSLNEGVTATDLTLRITEMLRKENVVGKFVEFFGEGAASLTVADRATIGNMAPEYGATIGFFPVDDKTLEYLRMTGRAEEHVVFVRDYLTAQNLFGIPRMGEIDYTKTLELNLNEVQSCVSGPKRPQDRINLPDVKSKFLSVLHAPINSGGYGKETKAPVICVHTEGSFSVEEEQTTGGTFASGDEKKMPWSETEMISNRPMTSAIASPGYIEAKATQCDLYLTHGSIVIAAITSCTNTSNPGVMIAAGLLAKKAVQKGLGINCKVKTSLAPGSRVVTDYLEKTGLQTYLDQLGFQLVGYGCTTCIGNSGPLDQHIEDAIKKHDLITASVLSGNRNFEARIHASVKANFLMSPPLVVAFAIAGKVNIDMEKEPLGMSKDGKPVYLREIWPSAEEIEAEIRKGIQPEMFRKRYANILGDNPIWQDVKAVGSDIYQWDPKSTYIQRPPYFDGFSLKLPERASFHNMRALAIFGDSVTTDHISPAGTIKADSPAGKYLLSLGITEKEFNSYGSRRGNHEVMVRGTFANVRLRNKMAEGKEGGFTKFLPEGTIIPIYDACQRYIEKKQPLIIFAGKDYGMGSSRDWAAKGTALLGVKAVVAKSFERIHRNNLIGMGVLPLQFQDQDTIDSLNILGDEIFSLLGIEDHYQPQQKVFLEISKGGAKRQITLIARLDTHSEIEYYRSGGILPFVLRQLLTHSK